MPSLSTADKALQAIPPVFYFPIKNGRYEVSPGLRRLQGPGQERPLDQQLFQLDRQFPHYRAMKLQARAERLDKYYCSLIDDAGLAASVCAEIVSRMCRDYPALFSLRPRGSDLLLRCGPSGEQLVLDQDYRLLQTLGSAPVEPPYRDTLDALACQLQEDLALLSLQQGEGRLLSLHLCFPNHWSAEDKIGSNFNRIHEPVADFASISRNATTIVNMMVSKGPYVRFAWGIATDDRLNHHPQPPAGLSLQAWQGRTFDAAQPQAWLRVERQVVLGLPAIDCALFTIRTYLYDLAEVARAPAHKQALISAISSMSSASLDYKGLAAYAGELLAWLKRI